MKVEPLVLEFWTAPRFRRRLFLFLFVLFFSFLVFSSKSFEKT